MFLIKRTYLANLLVSVRYIKYIHIYRERYIHAYKYYYIIHVDAPFGFPELERYSNPIWIIGALRYDHLWWCDRCIDDLPAGWRGWAWDTLVAITPARCPKNDDAIHTNIFIFYFIHIYIYTYIPKNNKCNRKTDQSKRKKHLNLNKPSIFQGICFVFRGVLLVFSTWQFVSTLA